MRADDRDADRSEDRSCRPRGREAVAGQKLLQRTALQKIAKPRAVFGTRRGLNEPDDRPGDVERHVRRTLEVGDQEESIGQKDAHGFAEHSRSLLFGVLVQREGEDDSAERRVRERKVEGRGEDEVSARVPSPTGGCDHRLRRVDAGRSNSRLGEVATLCARGARDVEDEGRAFLAADSSHGRAKRAKSRIDNASVDAGRPVAVPLTSCHGSTVDNVSIPGKAGLGSRSSPGENGTEADNLDGAERHHAVSAGPSAAGCAVDVVPLEGVGVCRLGAVSPRGDAMVYVGWAAVSAHEAEEPASRRSGR
jgi:hypothetical protein